MKATQILVVCEFLLKISESYKNASNRISTEKSGPSLTFLENTN